MRISDWSSDVCSTDLLDPRSLETFAKSGHLYVEGFVAVLIKLGGVVGDDGEAVNAAPEAHILRRGIILDHDPAEADRKSVGQGKRVSVRLDLGGRRRNKRKNIQDTWRNKVANK